MNPQPQTRRFPNGDCLRACIASLLEIPIKHVPDFTAVDPASRTIIDGQEYPTYYALMQSFLSTMNLALVEIVLTKTTPWPPLPFDTFVIFMGRKADGTKHAIVGKCHHNLMIPIFDPLAEDLDEEPFEGGVEGVAMLVPTDPWIPRRLGRGMEKILELLGTSMGQIPNAIRTEALYGLRGDQALVTEEAISTILDSTGRPINGSR